MPGESFIGRGLWRACASRELAKGQARRERWSLPVPLSSQPIFRCATSIRAVVNASQIDQSIPARSHARLGSWNAASRSVEFIGDIVSGCGQGDSRNGQHPPHNRPTEHKYRTVQHHFQHHSRYIFEHMPHGKTQLTE